MTQTSHTPIAYGAPLTSAVLNAPLEELDAAIAAVAATAAVSGANTTVDATSSSGQKVLNVTATPAPMVPGMTVFIGDPAGTYEYNTIASVQAGVSLTMTTNLANTYTAGATVAMHSGLLAIRYVLNGTTTYVPSVGTRRMLVECLGAGGAGGGVAQAATNAGAAGGGGGGGYSATWLTGAGVKASFTCAVGAGGTPGAAGANPGGAGGETTFDSASVCTAKGGAGGLADTVAAGPRVGGLGAAGGAAASGVGDMKSSGGPGGFGLALAAAQAVSGNGGQGAGALGAGGAVGLKTQSAGAAAGTYGAGGSGGCILSGGASVAGGAGSNGLIRVWEFA